MDINITNPVTTAKIGEVVNGANAATPNDTDLLPIVDTAVTKKITLTNFKAFLKTYFDTLYTGGGSVWGSITGTLSAQTDLQNALNAKQNSGSYATGTGTANGTNTGDNATNSTSNAYADAKVEDSIVDGVTNKAPSQNAVFDALALKAPLASPTFTGVVTTTDITVTGLTSTRVVFATTGGELTDDANLTFGSGNLNVGTSVTTPLLIGGSAVGDKVSVKATTGNGTLTSTGFEVLVGNNGATTAMSIFNNGNVHAHKAFRVGTTIGSLSSTTYGLEVTPSSIATNRFIFGPYSGVAATDGCIWYGNSGFTPSTANYNIYFASAGTIVNGTTTASLAVNNGIKIQALAANVQVYQPLSMSVATLTPASQAHLNGANATATWLKITNGTTTGTTAADGFNIGISSTGVGELRQRENLGIDIYTNNTLRATWNAGGGLTLADANDITTNATTGTKIGNGGKIGLFTATPIVQPTTGIAAAAFVANTSGIADDTATFDGYTIGQVVKALRNLGALA